MVRYTHARKCGYDPTSYTDGNLWDVIAELVHTCTSPSPSNPFAVDMDFFDSLPATERMLATAAMLSVLQRVLNSGPHLYNKRGIVLSWFKLHLNNYCSSIRCATCESVSLPCYFRTRAPSIFSFVKDQPLSLSLLLYKYHFSVLLQLKTPHYLMAKE